MTGGGAGWRRPLLALSNSVDGNLKMSTWNCGGNSGPFRVRRLDWSRFLGRKNKLIRATSRSRSHGAL